MPKAQRQKFRNALGVRQRTLSLNDEGKKFHDARPIEIAYDPALEAAVRPFLQDLTAKEREAVAVMYEENRPDERVAARKLGISQTALRERLLGRPERRSAGALAKIRNAIMAAVPPELRERLEREEDGAYADLRRWLTPAERIREDGTEDPWIEANCLVCGRSLAYWRPNTVMSTFPRYEEPRLICAAHMN